jgi:hypothetical protein
VIPTAHVLLHLALCGAMQKSPDGAALPVEVRMLDGKGINRFDETVTVHHYGATGSAQFDAPRGAYHMFLIAPHYDCAAQDYIYIIEDHQRTINEQLSDGVPPTTEPMIIAGSAPQSFLYLQPQYILLDKNTQCNQPVGDPIPIKTTIENDQDSFYIWMYPDASHFQRGQEMVTLQLQTPTGESHYIRLKIPFPEPWGGFPNTIQFNVTDDEVDWLAGQPTGVLLCPRLFRTSAG